MVILVRSLRTLVNMMEKVLIEGSRGFTAGKIGKLDNAWELENFCSGSFLVSGRLPCVSGCLCPLLRRNPSVGMSDGVCAQGPT